MTHHPIPIRCVRLLLPAPLLLASALAQTAPAPSATAPGAKAPSASRDPALSADAVELSPFTVNADKDDGFAATNAGTATKLGLDMKDMAAPYSVMTGAFIKALGIDNLQDAVMWSTNGTSVIDGQGADQFDVPSMYAVRGQVLNTGQQVDFFRTSAFLDTYDVERFDFGRGPNAVLFNTGANSVLGGGISAASKRARIDRNFETLTLTGGSWDYYRTTLDVNQRFGDNLAVRANAVLEDRRGYMEHAFEQVHGLSLAATQRLKGDNELRFQGSYTKLARTRPTFPSFDDLSGWDGQTVFDGPITNAMLSTTGTPGVPNSFGQTLTHNGEPQGVSRSGTDYVYIPGEGKIMDWVDMAATRRGDSTPWVPLYSGGQVYSRSGNSYELPLGNWAQQQRPATPGPYSNGDNVPFVYAVDLPNDRFDRALAASHFRIPDKRFTNVPKDPLFTQWNRNIGGGFTHRFSDNLFFEADGLYDLVHDKVMNNINGFRQSYIDINKNLPDGSPNPHFLDVYGEGKEQIKDVMSDNGGLRAVLNGILDLGKWGSYTGNLTGAYTENRVTWRQRAASIATYSDPRGWQSQSINIREYWNDTNRSFSPAGGLPATLFERTPSVDGNSFTTSTGAILPRWVLNDWGATKDRDKQGIFAGAGRYFDNRLVLSGGVRLDEWSHYVRSRPGYGQLPDNLNWDGFTLDDRYWLPAAPADWKSLTYVPLDKNGNPVSKTPIPALSRPTLPGSYGINPNNPLYANIRFRNDYSVPESHGTGTNSYYSAIYHLFPWMSFGGSYGESYMPRPGGQYFLDGTDAAPERGLAYDAVVRFSLFRERLDVSLRYYFDQRTDILGTPPGESDYNHLMDLHDYTDTSTYGHNLLGFPDIEGGDYFNQKNSGYEVEISGQLTRGWRLVANLGTAALTDYQRWKHTQAFFKQLAGPMEQVLEAAGGVLDKSQKNPAAASAPGLALDPQSTPALQAQYPNLQNPAWRNDQINAVNYYNDFWVQYDSIPTLEDTVSVGQLSAKFFTDYTIQTGRFKDLRFGIGFQYFDKVVAGYRSGDTIANPNFDPTKPISATNLNWIHNPAVDANTPVWVKRPFEVTGTMGYSFRLKSGPAFLQDKPISLNLIVRNLLNSQRVIFQDEGVALRNPNGDFYSPVRVSVPGRIGMFEQPINFELSTTIEL